MKKEQIRILKNFYSNPKSKIVSEMGGINHDRFTHLGIFESPSAGDLADLLLSIEKNTSKKLFDSIVDDMIEKAIKRMLIKRNN